LLGLNNAMPVLAPHRFSVKEYYRMAETGVLKPDARVELLDGQIIDMAPIGPFHSGSLNRLNRHFNRLSKGRWLVSAQNPVRLNKYSDPQPDLLLLKPSADDYTTRHPLPAEVFLLIEIAESSLAYDRREKLPAYGRAGIQEVWILNLNERVVEVYREPNSKGYKSSVVLRTGDKACPMAFPDVGVDVAELLK